MANLKNPMNYFQLKNAAIYRDSEAMPTSAVVATLNNYRRLVNEQSEIIDNLQARFKSQIPQCIKCTDE